MKNDRKSPHQIDIEVGNRIMLQRKKRGMSQSALGAAIGITFQQIQKYEKGANRVGAGRLNHIAQVLGVTVTHFFAESDAPAEHTERPITSDSSDLIRFVLGKEGRELNTAFNRIGVADMKRKFVRLVEAVARSSGTTE